MFEINKRKCALEANVMLCELDKHTQGSVHGAKQHKQILEHWRFPMVMDGDGVECAFFHHAVEESIR